MITNRIFQTAALLWVLVLPAQASEKTAEKADYVEQDGTIVLHGSIAAIPNWASSFESWKNCRYSSNARALAHTFPQIQDKDTTSQFCYTSEAVPQDWDSHWHPLLGCCVVNQLPALLPIAYKAPSPHPYFLKKEVAEHLTQLPIPLRGIVSDYAAHPSTLLDCTEGDTIQIMLANHNNKKVLAQLTCTRSYGRPFRIQIARGLVENEKIPTSLRDQLNQEIQENENQQQEKQKKEQERLSALLGLQAEER